MIVRLIKNWLWPDLFRQTPDREGIWDDIHFTHEPVECDYVVSLNHVPQDTTVQCPPQNLWAIMQEPPVGRTKPMHRGVRSYRLIFTQDTDLKGKRYIYSQPALPWHVNKDYDYLRSKSVPKKERALSWITSNRKVLPGHKARMNFLDKINKQIEFDLYGRGFMYVDDKWDGLAPYRYSIAVENYSNPYYWSEKISDCFLSWCMPIYYGCTRMDEYFPSDAFVQIDIDDPDRAIEKMQEAISNDLWRKNLDAISYARKLILQKYQLFPFLTNKIKDWEKKNKSYPSDKQIITVRSKFPYSYYFKERLKRLMHRCLKRLQKIIK